jgi:hypothetical protein
MVRNLYDLFKKADHNIQCPPFSILVILTNIIFHRKNGAVSIKLARRPHMSLSFMASTLPSPQGRNGSH